MQRIYAYYKEYDYKTIVMGASFRNADQIRQLAGCDRLTISPGLMQELADNHATLEKILDPEAKRFFRHLVRAEHYRNLRISAFAEWSGAVA